MGMEVFVRTEVKDFTDSESQISTSTDQDVFTDIVAIGPTDIVWSPKA